MLSYWHQDDCDDDPRVEDAVVHEHVCMLHRQWCEFKDLSELEDAFSWALDLDDWRGELQRQQSWDARAEWWAKERERNRQLAAARQVAKFLVLNNASCPRCGEPLYVKGELEQLRRMPSRERTRCWNCKADDNVAAVRARYRRRAWSNDLAQMQHLINEAEEYEVATP